MKLEERRISSWLLTKAMDTATAGRVPLFGIMASLVEFERRLIRERTMAGLASARSQGQSSVAGHGDDIGRHRSLGFIPDAGFAHGSNLASISGGVTTNPQSSVAGASHHTAG